MSFLHKAKQVAETAAKAASVAAKKVAESAENAPNKAQELFTFIKTNLPKTIPLQVSETRLNEIAARAIDGNSRIQSLMLRCETNILMVETHINVAGFMVIKAKTRLALEQCEINSTRKIIIMRRLDQAELSGTGAASLLAYAIKTIICGLFSIDIIAFVLKNIRGLTIDKNKIIADLEVMNAMDAINEAIHDKIQDVIVTIPINPIFKKILEPTLPSIIENLTKNISIENLAIIQHKCICGTLRLS